MLSKSIRYASNFPIVVKTGSTSFNELLKCCIEFIIFQQRSDRLCKLQRATQVLYRIVFNSSQTGFVSSSSVVENFQFSNSSQQQAQRLPAVSSELWYCRCLVLGNKAFTVLVFRALGFSTTDYGYPCAYSCQVIMPFLRENVFNKTRRGHKRSSGRKRYYFQLFKHPPRVAAARVLRDNPP